MRIHLIAMGNRMPEWIQAGFFEYAKRMPKECRLALKEIPLKKRDKHTDTQRLIEQEGKQMLAAIPPRSRIIALDKDGHQWTTEQLSQQLSCWLQSGLDLALLIGGPEGLAPACLQHAQDKWSLSKMTFPHPLVRIIVAEQLYRAWSLLQGHPYHR
ncbi:MAG: 23S rRNA (pseudouridine(1915)-N(3))-methyltransferase RlmH [Methylothermaceae bacteria B42]|nr:MAG: 23S rRNA (pseudouridine(1915)-N(3))-methyltransferase RlmH [Methylothermaceae bacteria B42]HHJ40340.1 23S rRNA (pseudouridine(1915)-N(3))-methyltransferase RlmH [Methylothermaceae bacterium]